MEIIFKCSECGKEAGKLSLGEGCQVAWKYFRCVCGGLVFPAEREDEEWIHFVKIVEQRKNEAKRPNIKADIVQEAKGQACLIENNNTLSEALDPAFCKE